MSKNEVSHEGTILEITPEFTTVEIIAQSACAACHARGLCGVADEKQKIIMVPTDPYGSYKEGDKVLVLLKKSMGMKAVWISYVNEGRMDILCDSFVHFNDFNIIFVVRYRARSLCGSGGNRRGGPVLPCHLPV